MRIAFNKALSQETVEQTQSGAHKGLVRPVDKIGSTASGKMHAAYHAPHAIDPDAPMPGNVSGCYSKPVLTGKKK